MDLYLHLKYSIFIIMKTAFKILYISNLFNSKHKRMLIIFF